MTDVTTHLSAALRYQERLSAILAEACTAEAANIAAAARIIADTFAKDGLLYVFGSGHSHMFAEEAFYRAGGATRVCPILKPEMMLHEGAVQSTILEREHGHASSLLARYLINPDRDCLLVASNSGANALPVEVAQHGRNLGMTVIGITSRQFAQSIDRPGPRLHEVVDLVIDNHCPPGDALIDISPEHPSAGPASTVVGLALLNSVIVQACSLSAERGVESPIFLSSNSPGAKEHNAAVVDRLRSRVPHL